MFWFVSVVAIIVILASLVAMSDASLRIGAGIAIFAAVFIWILTTIFSSAHQIPYNYVGVVTNFGSISGRTGDGLVFTAPWKDVTPESTRIQVQRYTFTNVPSVENQSLTAHVAITYHVDGTKVMSLYHDYGANWYDNLIGPYVEPAVHNVAGTFPATEAHSHPNVVSQKILSTLTGDLSNKKHGADVTIVSVNATFELPSALEEAILAKQVALQNADTEKNKVQVSRYQGEQSLVKAQEQAKANQVLSNSISNRLIQYESIQKLSGDVKVCIVPSGSTILAPCSISGGLAR